jgi:Zn-dependent protease
MFEMTNSLNSSIPVIIVCIVVSLVIHEFMHALAGYMLGDSTAQERGRLSLNPLNHIDPFMTLVLPTITLLLFGVPILAAKPVPFDPDRVKFEEFGGALIALAGPVSNLVLAFLSALALRHLTLSNFLGEALVTFTVLNVALFVFNILPIPPLDGSRVLYAFAPDNIQDFMRSIEPYGLFIVFALVLGFGLGGLLQNIDQYIINLLP